MKPQWQQQQGQIRRQQEQMQQKQMAAAWMEQQKAKKQPVDAASSVGDRFATVEQAVARVQRHLAAGKLTQDQAKTQMKEMMVQDDEGFWWTIGFETGGWYKYMGDSWVSAQPHRLVMPSVFPTASASSSNPRRFQAIVVLIIGLAITAGAGFLAGNIASEQFRFGDTEVWIIAIVFWLMGFWITIKRTRKLWQGQ